MCIGPAKGCNEMGHFPAILRILKASHTIAHHGRYLPQNLSSVASQLPTVECFSYSPAISIAAMAYRNI